MTEADARAIVEEMFGKRCNHVMIIVVPQGGGGNGVTKEEIEEIMSKFGDKIDRLANAVASAKERESVEDAQMADLQRRYDELKAQAEDGSATPEQLKQLDDIAADIEAFNAANSGTGSGSETGTGSDTGSTGSEGTGSEGTSEGSGSSDTEPFPG